ncbi:MAG: DUF1294 domain-containing protein [Lachnospiraceae bacterium]|jgi:hypothetical protein|nr:DUF1294 domain-containing protein [Lachnospiraceae bacterium]MBQ5375773.1 DUF1294 domain-containing protein [Lachnospiraceae bacterium]
MGFAFMGIDKWKAKKRAWRIPESTLFLVALLGGALGSLIGMYTFRHKTRHASFVWGMPIILVLHILVLVFIIMGPVMVL